MITGVTTFSHKIWEQYAAANIKGWADKWPGKIIAYHEDAIPADLPKSIRRRNLCQQQDAMRALKWAEQMPFLKGEMPNGEYNYNFNFHKFSRKVFAITDALAQTTGGIVYWLDADLEMVKPIPESFLREQVEGVYTAYLGRKDFPHTETGIVAYDTNHEWNERFPAMYRAMFSQCSVLGLPGFHDCWGYDYLVGNDHGIPARNLTADAPGVNVFPQSPFGEYMRHHKGPKKELRGAA